MLLALRFTFNLPLRQLQGFTGSILEMLKIEAAVPNYTTICRRSLTLGSHKVKQYQPLKEGEALHIAIDSTGLSIFSASPKHASKYYQDRSARKGEAWKKLHVTLDLQSAQIINCDLTSSRVSDACAWPKLIERFPQPLASVSADRAYSTVSVHRTLEEIEAAALIPTKCNYKAQKPNESNFSKYRNEIIEFVKKYPSYEDGIKEWKISSGYHQRSRVETYFHRFKKAFGYHLKSKTPANQLAEVISKVNILNKATTTGQAIYEKIEV